MASFVAANAQDTLYYEPFKYDESTQTIGLRDSIADAFPSGLLYDPVSYNVDGDGIADASGGNRDDAWFLSFPFADADDLDSEGDSNIVFMSNSWLEAGGTAANYFILPSMLITSNNGQLSWTSASRQTPLYLDGYKVLVSTSSNFEGSFTDTLFVAAEYLSAADPLPDSTFAGFTFSDGYVQGLNGQFIEYDGDSLRFRGILEPHSVSLANYQNQKIFIAFLHDATDDNLISLDNILVTGTGSVNVEEDMLGVEASMFPIPAKDITTLSFSLAKTTNVAITITDMNGRIVSNQSYGARGKGNHTQELNVSNLANGMYTLTLATAIGKKVINFSVAR